MPTGNKFMEKQSKIGGYIPRTEKLLSPHGAINNSLPLLQSLSPSLITLLPKGLPLSSLSTGTMDTNTVALFKAWTFFNFRHVHMVMRLARLIIAKVFLYV